MGKRVSRIKKALGKSKANKSAKKKRSPKSKKPVDLAEVRRQITEIVGGEAAALALAVVEEARKGQLAPVKYLFEVAGLYPPTEGSQAKPEEASLARTLLHRLGIPGQPVISQDDEPPVKPGLPAGKPGNEAEEGSDNPASQPKSQNDKGADEGDDVPVLAESIP